MKTKHFLLTIATLLCATFTFAQTAKGGMLLGGSAGFDVQFEEPDNFVSVDLQPTLGFFVADNLAVGGSLVLGYGKIGDFSSTTFGLIPFGRYYLGEGNTRFFLQAQVGFQSTKTDSGFGDSTASGPLFGAGPGVAIFLNQNVAIEGILAYNRYAGDYDISDLGLRFGVQAYFGGE